MVRFLIPVTKYWTEIGTSDATHGGEAAQLARAERFGGVGGGGEDCVVEMSQFKLLPLWGSCFPVVNFSACSTIILILLINTWSCKTYKFKIRATINPNTSSELQIPFIWKHVQSNCKISFSIFIKNQFPGIRFNSNGKGFTRVLVVTAKWYFNLTNPCYDRVTCNWYLHDFVTINCCLSSVSGDSATACQWSG